jgi:DNA-directed RNA polymerase
MNKNAQDYLKRLEKQDISAELQCVNALQRTPWRVNKQVLEVIRNVWDSGQEWAGLPPKDDIPLPHYPFDVEPCDLDENQKVEFAEWRKQRNSIHQFNNKSRSKRIQVERTIQLAEEYAKFDKFYFVWQLDFRGRKYPVESFMSPQVADWGKACIEFANGMKIENVEDAKWLAIHGANTFGEDKISLEDREIWAYLNTENVRKTVDDPYNFLWWTEADKPFQFLAWVYEWFGYTSGDPEWVTRLPVAADGSCNGLQHLSAILRDEEGGKAVNLVDSSLPSDIYRDVAEAATIVVKRDALSGNQMAKKCLEFGIDRKLTKRSVMIVPYSGTKHACRQYVEEAIEEKVAKGATDVFEGDYFGASLYLTDHIWDAIDSVIGSARKVMDYVKDIGVLYAERNIPMEWITPTNLLVQQAYNDFRNKQISTIIDGSIVKLRYRKPLDDVISKSKTRSGASPNFVHSLDAAALTLTVNKCLDWGIKDFAMVHDSYGTHSPNMEKMSELLREAFVEMYQENDVLWQLRTHTQKVLQCFVEYPPESGDLDIGKVLNSKYFFA